jgi:hypothetical protein
LGGCSQRSFDLKDCRIQTAFENIGRHLVFRGNTPVKTSLRRERFSEVRDERRTTPQLPVEQAVTCAMAGCLGGRDQRDGGVVPAGGLNRQAPAGWTPSSRRRGPTTDGSGVMRISSLTNECAQRATHEGPRVTDD